jgi:hypothetical protein
VVEVLESGTELFGVGVVEVVEDRQGLLPGDAGLPRVARGMVGVTEVGVHLGLAVPFAEIPVQAEGALIAGGGFGVMAEVVVG